MNVSRCKTDLPTSCPNAKNGDHFLTPTSPQNRHLFCALMTAFGVNEINLKKVHFLDRFEPLFCEHGPKNWNVMEKVSFEVKDQTQGVLGFQLLDFGGDTRFVSFDNFHFLISPVYVLKLVDFVSSKWSTALWHLTFFRCLVLKTKRDIVGGEKRESLGWNSEWPGKQVSWCLMIAGVESCPAELYKLWGRKWEWTPPGRKPWAFTKQHPYTNFAVKTEQHTEKSTKKWKFWLKKKQEQCWPGLD